MEREFCFFDNKIKERREEMIIKIKKIREDAIIPVRASDGAIGYDVFASRVLDKFTKEVIGELPAIILPGKSVLFGIGVKMAVPWPFQCEMRPRSGMASKYDVELSNSPGTIDPDFRGEAGVLLRNKGDSPFSIEKNMRVAQLIFTKAEVPLFEEIKDELSVTKRNDGGFGSTGLTGKGLGTVDYDARIRKTDEYYMGIVLAAAKRSTCVRGVKKIDGKYECDEKGELVGQTRRFGCLIVKDDNILAQGFNDQYPGSPKCVKAGCLREELKIPSGTKIETCRAMHAEWWAITNALKGGTTGVKDATIYINAEPCEICAKIIAGLKVETVVMLEGIYPTNGIGILKEAEVNIRYTR
jgi:dUTP pyrophosphatase